MAGVCGGRYCLLNDFLLQHDQPSDFVHCVFFTSPMPYAVGVTAVSIHLVSMSVYSIVSSAYGEKILIWLTYWSLFVLTARFVLTAFNAWSYVYQQRKVGSGGRDGAWDLAGKKKGETAAESSSSSVSASSAASSSTWCSWCCPRVENGEDLPVLYKAQWVLQNVSSSAAFIVSGLYWVLLYNPNKTESARSINSHLLNFVFSLTDLLISRAPIRIHHFIYTFAYITAYVIFTLIYWGAGGTNHLGDHYIYTYLDYSEHPGRALGIVLAVDFVGTPLVQILLYLLFRLREYVRLRCRQRKELVLSQDVQVSNTSLGSSIRHDKRQSGDKEISLDELTDDQPKFHGRNYTLTSNKDEGDVVIDVDLDFEMDEVSASFRPQLQTNSSQVSCTDSTKALLT